MNKEQYIKKIKDIEKKIKKSSIYIDDEIVIEIEKKEKPKLMIINKGGFNIYSMCYFFGTKCPEYKAVAEEHKYNQLDYITNVNLNKIIKHLNIFLNKLGEVQ